MKGGGKKEKNHDFLLGGRSTRFLTPNFTGKAERDRTSPPGLPPLFPAPPKSSVGSTRLSSVMWALSSSDMSLSWRGEMDSTASFLRV